MHMSLFLYIFHYHVVDLFNVVLLYNNNHKLVASFWGEQLQSYAN